MREKNCLEQTLELSSSRVRELEKENENLQEEMGRLTEGELKDLGVEFNRIRKEREMAIEKLSHAQKELKRMEEMKLQIREFQKGKDSMVKDLQKAYNVFSEKGVIKFNL